MQAKAPSALVREREDASWLIAIHHLPTLCRALGGVFAWLRLDVAPVDGQ